VDRSKFRSGSSRRRLCDVPEHRETNFHQQGQCPISLVTFDRMSNTSPRTCAELSFESERSYLGVRTPTHPPRVSHGHYRAVLEPGSTRVSRSELSILNSAISELEGELSVSACELKAPNAGLHELSRSRACQFSIRFAALADPGNTFCGCLSLKSFCLPSVDHVGDGCLHGSRSLSSLTFPPNWGVRLASPIQSSTWSCRSVPNPMPSRSELEF
jgi:hypothetical protein